MSKNALKFFSVSILIILSACVPQKFELPSYEGRDLKEVMADMQNITEIETTVSILFEKVDSGMSGDGALNISRGGDMSLRVYSLGFLAMEVTAREGAVQSTPHLDNSKVLILTKGLRDCLFWWDMKDFNLSEDRDGYLLTNSERTLWLDRRTFLPRKQVIRLGDGDELTIFYEDPARENNVWYQSKMRIELSRYRVTVKVKNISFRT